MDNLQTVWEPYTSGHAPCVGPLLLIAGPCVIESYETTFAIASYLKLLTNRYRIPFLFKASYDKANRSSISSYRGPGPTEGLKILYCIKRELGIRITSDVHRVSEVERAAEVLDVIQIPAFLSRQTDLLTAVAATVRPINIKKGQFMSPYAMGLVAEKCKGSQVMFTERGTFFGYNDLVVDMRSISIMKGFGAKVIFDATHSAGARKAVPRLAMAAVAAGADGVFLETHPNPDKALCDGPSSIQMHDIDALLSRLIQIHKILI